MRVAGFRVTVHWSTLAVFALIVWSLAAVRLPLAAPGASDGAYLVAGVVTGLAFYGALLAHELAHAVLARRAGIEVVGVTLWLLGGVASFRDEARDPGTDLRIAGAGPAVSLALAAAAALVAVVLDAAGASALVVATVRWLAGINLLLGAFNLIPAAPLDGGRVLRAALWRWRGDRTWATVQAARAGQLLGYALMALGVGDVVAGFGYGGVWFVFVGWFVLGTARGEQAAAVARRRLEGIRVGEAMHPEPVVVQGWLNLNDLVDEHVAPTGRRLFPVAAPDGRLTGLVTTRRVEEVPPPERGIVAVRSIATPLEAVPTARPDEFLVDVLPRLAATPDGAALVLVDDRLVGVLGRDDVARAYEIAARSRPAAGANR